jgi:3-oxoacyl-[acyl-carrier-protein] synthase-3
LRKFANTSSATIPITINTELRGKIENKRTRFVCCGFGIGLSWGTVIFDTENIVLSELVEI